ncbi:MAG TPA: hypothetical protein VFZ68_06360 [Acidimicrobiales bacterium]
MRWRRAPRSALTGVEPFRRHRTADLAPLARHADRLDVRPGVVLAREGWQPREAFVVVAGEIVASVEGEAVGRFGPGSLVGVADVLGRAAMPRTLTSGAGLEVVVLPAPAVRWAAQAVPGLWEGAGAGAWARMAPCRSASTSPSTAGSAAAPPSPGPPPTPRTSGTPASG